MDSICKLYKEMDLLAANSSEWRDQAAVFGESSVIYEECSS